MNTGDGGLAKHDQTCPNNIQWQESCIIAKETNTQKRKFLESLETMRTIYNKKIPLNTHAEIDYWKYFLNLAFRTTSNDLKKTA